jgi:hypothetical protein
MCDKTFYLTIHSLLMFISATLPLSIATAERTFSVLKYLKSYLRSSTSEEHLNELALSYIHRDIDQTVDLIVSGVARICIWRGLGARSATGTAVGAGGRAGGGSGRG